MKKLAVVAFGGNALLRPGEKGTVDEQERNVYETCKHLLHLIQRGHDVVVTHGNGPQVGNILLQNQAGAQVHGIPEMPLDICGAYSQGLIGYMIEQQLKNVFGANGIDKDVITLITQVFVDKNDSAFANPTKPIGPYYTKEQSDKIASETGSVFQEDPKGNGWRKVVASPMPTAIGNQKSIEKLAREGKIVVAVGGGGIPVFYPEPNKIQGIDAVIDKDLASALLAAEMKADEFYILTDVSNVYINFRKPDEQALKVVTVAQAKEYIAQGQFTAGSMGPKVGAAIYYVEHGGKECIITSAESLHNPECGTKIIA